MTVLSDAALRRRLAQLDARRLGISPLHHADVQPCTIDLYLGDEIKHYVGVVLDPALDNSGRWKPHRIIRDGPDANGRDPGWILAPGKLYLGATRELIEVPEDLVGVLMGCSSVARDGIQIHMAGLLDPGYRGHPTLEITVAAGPTVLRPGMRIGQVMFLQLDQAAEAPYRGRYQDDVEPMPAKAAVANGARA